MLSTGRGEWVYPLHSRITSVCRNRDEHYQHHDKRNQNHHHIRWTRDGGPLPVLDFDFKDLEGIKTILTPDVTITNELKEIKIERNKKPQRDQNNTHP